ncbi:hypothetical protein [Aureispira sp. CCB-QB1]|uniref:hypothetical protein n=1 Tax=Aureispira sp. CCB-QB1 TaxID=1313421 RepID=UPI0012DC0EAE|nr:hypothetical protein [Aureispira sp. CCB-QB1]
MKLQDKQLLATKEIISSGVAVSPNDRYLYVSSWIYMYQFDLWASNIAASKDTVAVYGNVLSGTKPPFWGYIQSALDGKIYSHSNNVSYMDVINNPNIGGVGCNVVQRGLDVFFVEGHFLPNMPHYRTPKLSGSACDTLTSIARIESKEDVLIYPNPASTSISIAASSTIEQVVVLRP